MNPFYTLVADRAAHRCEYCHAPELVFNLTKDSKDRENFKLCRLNIMVRYNIFHITQSGKSIANHTNQ